MQVFIRPDGDYRDFYSDVPPQSVVLDDNGRYLLKVAGVARWVRLNLSSAEADFYTIDDPGYAKYPVRLVGTLQVMLEEK